MIILLGATGYIGQAFAKELKKRKIPFQAWSRSQIDYTDYSTLLKHLKNMKAKFVINAAGYTGKPNVDICELNWSDTLVGNVFFPTTVAHACAATRIPWGHVSSGCIYNGAKIIQNKETRIEKDMLKARQSTLTGFIETDIPNFSFRNKPCSFYSGTKALAEEMLLKNASQNYIWRLRIPFDENDSPRNYLSKIQRYDKVYNNVNSLSHLGDFVCACLDLWKIKAPYGIYNITNPGFITTEQVVGMIQRILKPNRKFTFWKNDKEFYRKIAKTPRSNCILDVSKLLQTGIKIRSVEEALSDALSRWVSFDKNPEKK